MGRYTIQTEDGEDIALIIDTDNKKKLDIHKIVYISDNFDKNSKKDEKITRDKLEYIYKNFVSKTKKRINFKKMEDLLYHIKEQRLPVGDVEMENLYNEAMNILTNEFSQSMILTQQNHIFFPTFTTEKERSIFFITGASGSGKSTYASNLSAIYNKLHPKNRIYLFSNKSFDPVFQKDYIKRIDITNEELFKNPLDLAELEDSLVIYDDNEFGKNKKIDEELKRLSDLIMLQGRSKRISYILINHLMNDYKKTRNILNEMSHFTFFPSFSTRYSINYVLSKFFGLSKKSVDWVYGLHSRAITIQKSPLILISEKEIKMLS